MTDVQMTTTQVWTKRLAWPVGTLLAVAAGLTLNRLVPTGDWHTLGQVIAILAVTALVIAKGYNLLEKLGMSYFDHQAKKLRTEIENRPTPRQLAYRAADEANRRKLSADNNANR